MKVPIEALKTAMPLSLYLQNYYKLDLRKSGNVFVCNCPFHEEKTGSFVVFKDNYHCYGCGEHGDIINFTQKKERLGFKEACELIAQNEGIEYTIEPPNKYHEQYKNIMEEHSNRYAEQLLATDNNALDYLTKERGLTIESIKKFRLGLVPDKEYKSRNDIGGISNRISFPIFENKNKKYAKCLGMGYRTLVPGEKPKYINDKNQSDQNSNLYGVFIKGNCLYGYQEAEESIRKRNFAIIVEGYMDVISLHQSGIKNTVGAMGTSVTQAQIDSIAKLTKNVILFLDGDNAGVTNMFRILPMFLKTGINVKMIVAKNNKDAADICKDFNFDTRKVYNYICVNSKLALEYMLNLAFMEYSDVVMNEKRKIYNKIMPIINCIENEIDKELYLSSLKKKLEIV